MSIAAIILAAGESSRLGRPKQDIVLGGETLLNRAVRVATEAGLSPIVVVVRESRFNATPEAQGAIVLLNPRAHEGMASSIRCGAEWAKQRNATGVLVMTCDQPGVRSDHLRALAAEPSVRTGSEYAGRVGVPAYFPVPDFDALMALEGDVGARDLLRNARAIPQKDLSIDIDTEEDFRVAQILFEK